MTTPLNPNQLRFINYVTADEKRNAAAAYARAYGLEDGQVAAACASRLMADPRVKAEIAKRDAERAARLNMTADDLVRELRDVVTADPRDLMEYYRGACRHCYGHQYKRQRTPAEYEADFKAYKRLDAARKGGPIDPLGLDFDPEGGIGFNPTREPNPDCPECFGQGVGYSYVKDTRTLSRGAARLFAGIKETKDGIEVKTRNVDKLHELYMRHLGMLEAKKDDETAEDKAAQVRALVAALGATTGGPT